MDILEKIYLVMFTICICIIAYSNYKCMMSDTSRFNMYKMNPSPGLKKLNKIKSKFEVGDYIQDTNAPVIKRVTGFYVTDSGNHMTTVVAVENFGNKVEPRNQSSAAYSTVALNTYYKKIDYVE